ncbi:MAG: DUF92 domain-containing protein [Candidatus Eremiobacteraeota bacterium]|nr:DUF92 domain-containing protein [Candidatus Eremiobacteraeota bacterium]
MRLLAGALLATAVAFAAFRLKTLTAGGALAAVVIGTIVFACGTWVYTAVLFAFFLPSIVLSRARRARKKQLRDIGKHGPRDARQVAANGGVAAICALLSLRFPHAAAGFAGAFAAASADTWATEIGTLAKQQPRSILTLRPLQAGFSGGITVTGTIAQACGAVLLATVAALLGAGNLAAIALGGFAGATIDSLAGASVQALRYCARCNRDCETNPHSCGSSTVVRRGFAPVDNDAVNLLATAGGALIAYLLSIRTS